MKCPECGFDNLEGTMFCDDCGVALSDNGLAKAEAGSGALELGQILNERWKIARVVHYDSRIGFYEAEDTQDGSQRALVVEGHSFSDELDAWVRVLSELESPLLWYPQEMAVQDGRLFVLGPWPGEPLPSCGEEMVPSAAGNLMRQVLLALEALRGAGWNYCPLSVNHVWRAGDKVTLLTAPAPRGEVDVAANTAVIEGFSAPEMYGLMGGQVGERTDVFSAGALLYHLLNKGELNIKRLGIGCFGIPDTAIGPDGPLMDVAAKALKREPLERFATVQEMRFALEEALARLNGTDDEEIVPEFVAPHQPDSKITQPLPTLAPAKVAKVPSSVATASLSERNVSNGDNSAQASGVQAVVAQAGQAQTENAYTENGATDEAKQEAEGSHPTVDLQAEEQLPSDVVYEVGRLTNVGAVRKINQDAFVEMRLWACERDVPTEVHFLAVIDGMGGEAEGDKAASIAARAAANEVVQSFLALPGAEGEAEKELSLRERQAKVLVRAMKKANSAILAYASENSARKGMGCTMSAALITRGLVTVGHVGDTRVYKFDGELHQLTRDHSVVGQLVEMGALTKEQARHSPKRSIIYRALGTAAEIEIETYQSRLQQGDYLFMSSDGVWEYYSDAELHEFFAAGEAPQTICEKLVSACLKRGADDNTTAIVFRYLP